MRSLDLYREWLMERYARANVNRRLVVLRSLYAEARRRGLIRDDPAERLRGLRGRDDRDGGVLSDAEARAVLDAILVDLVSPGRELRAHRDLAVVSLALRTGLRRREIAAIRVADLGQSQGHNVLTITGKGAVLRTIKIPVDVRLLITSWMVAAESARLRLDKDDPLFVALPPKRHDAGPSPLSDRAVYDIVRRRLRDARVSPLGPHALRATFVTMALEGGAPLHLVQRAVGHADPITTERYWRRKNALDDNATDYVRL
jgi:integrase/recombinase XerC